MNKSTFSKFFALTLVLVACSALTACSDGDKDGDGVRDNADQCITVSAGRTPDPARPGCPAGDLDRDGIFDRDDLCPGMPVGNGIETDPNRVGCPAPVVMPTLPPTITCGTTAGDCDSDGVLDNLDQCPSVARSAHPSAARNGCPWEDRDGDGVEDLFDDCIDEKANAVVDGGQSIADGGLPNDPARPGCLLRPAVDAGSAEDTSVNPDASVTADATNTDPDSGTVQAVDASDVTDVQDATDATDAGVTATNDVPPGNGNTTIIVQVSPPTPTPVVDAGAPSQPIPTERNVAGLAIGTLIEGTSGRTAANTFCWITRRQVDYLMTHAFNRECREGETSCWRLANANVHVLDCGTTATPGCRFQDGRIFACETGAENIVVRHCAQGTVPCTAQNVVDAERTRHPSR